MSAPVSSAAQERVRALEFVLVRPGTFMMGCSPSDPECYSEEKPCHKIEISLSFELAKFQVTQSQYKEVMGCNPSYFLGPNHPVDGVSWEDAQKFCERLNAGHDGYHYRLPTEAEWEYAARAGNTSARYGPLNEIAWYHDNSDGTTHPVGLKKPNAFGLFDTLGNVWEWVQDRYAPDYYSHSPGRDPQGPLIGEYRVARGGSWRGIARGLARVSSRYVLRAGVRSIVVGFRCARQPASSSPH